MRILFLVPGNSKRNGYINGYNIRYGGVGSSGTDASNILVAEFLAKNNHDVVIAIEENDYGLENDTFGRVINGVYYSDINLGYVLNKTFDIIITNLWYEEFNKLEITINRAIIYWSHMAWMYSHSEVIEFAKKNNLKIGIVNPSKWAEKLNNEYINIYKNTYDWVSHVVIPNPLVSDVLEEIRNENIVKNKDQFVFHAIWGRGGDVAVDFMTQIKNPNKKLISLQYVTDIVNRNETFIEIRKSTDKKNLYRIIAQSEYFIFPLFGYGNLIYKDTFSCATAEAIALGAIPITYPFGALHELYSDYIQWASIPSSFSDNEINKKVTVDEDLLLKSPKPLLEAYDKLKNNNDFKKYVKQNGFNYILNNFSQDVVGNKWLKFIDDVS